MFYGNYLTLHSHTNTVIRMVISHKFAYSPRWRRKPWQGLSNYLFLYYLQIFLTKRDLYTCTLFFCIAAVLRKENFVKIALFKHSNMGSKPCDFFSRSVINKVNEAEPTESKVPFWKLNQIILKRFFVLLEFSIYQKRTWFFVVYIFLLWEKKLWNT